MGKGLGECGGFFPGLERAGSLKGLLWRECGARCVCGGNPYEVEMIVSSD